MKTVFKEITEVPDWSKRRLKSLEALNPDGTVVSWGRLWKALKKKEMTDHMIKQLITIEVNAASPRFDVLMRLVGRINRTEKRTLLTKIKTQLQK